jgi:hypothetical protein
MEHNDWRRDPIWQAVGTIVSVVAVLLAALALPNEVRALGVIIVLLGAVLCFLLLFKRPFGASNRSSQQPPYIILPLVEHGWQRLKNGLRQYSLPEVRFFTYELLKDCFHSFGER